MFLIGLKLKNFRCYKEEVFLSLSKLTAIVGGNDVGKSSLLDALDIFFNEGLPDSGDLNSKFEQEEIKITAIFSVDNEVVIDSDVRVSLKDEYLLNEEGNLEVVKTFTCKNGKGKLAGVFLKANHPSVKEADDLHSVTISELKKRCKNLGLNATDINLTISSQLRQKIWKNVGDLILKPKVIPVFEKDAKSIWDQLKRQLPLFAVFKSDRASSDQDSEAQDPMRLAIKEALKKEEGKLNEISDSVMKEVMAVAKLTIEKIKEMDPRLASELNPRISLYKPEGIFKVSLTSDDEIQVNKRGSGVRRLILLNFFRAQAEKASQEKSESTGIIYAIEEPETSQEAKNQRLLMRSFMELSQNENSQILLTTHTPFVDGFLPLQSLRYLERLDDGTRLIHNTCDDAILGMIVKSLGVLPENGVKLFVGLEGMNDINFLIGMSKLLNQSDNSYPDLEKLESNRTLIFIPVGGSNLKFWINRLSEMNRPEYHIYDRDSGEKTNQNQSNIDGINSSKRKFCKAVLTKKREAENYIHPTAVKKVFGFSCDITIDDNTDVAELVAKLKHEMDNPSKDWQSLSDKDKKEKASKVKKRLNTECVAAMDLQMLNEIDAQNEIKGWLLEMQRFMDEFDKR